MAIPADQIGASADSSNERIREWSAIFYREMDSAIEHSRWMTMLCMAEIAAIAGYNELEHGELNLLWALVVLALALSIGIFVFSIISSRATRMKVQKRVAGYPLGISEFIDDATLSPIKIRVALMEAETKMIESVNKSQYWPNQLETIGHWLFLLASAYAGLLVLMLEFGDMLRDMF